MELDDMGVAHFRMDLKLCSELRGKVSNRSTAKCASSAIPSLASSSGPFQTGLLS